MSKCINCFTILEAKRSTKKYCCTECKNNYNRKITESGWLYLYQNGNMTRIGTTKAPHLIATIKVKDLNTIITRYGLDWFVGDYTSVLRDIITTPLPISPMM